MSKLTENYSNPKYTKDETINEEIEKVELFRQSLELSNQEYVDQHPELSHVLEDFVKAIFAQKPTDLVKFGAFYFNNVAPRVGPIPIVCSGPSGVGKGTLINRLLTTFPHVFGFSVSHTTRAPRNGEIDGVHYNFVSKADFEAAVERGEFVEYAKVHTNYYGTSFQAIEKIRLASRVCLLDIDIQGLQNVRRSKLDCKAIFVTPPSLEELENRLKARGTETPDKTKIRLENAVGEIAFGHTPGNFDEILVNDNVDDAFHRFVEILQKWYPEIDLYPKDMKV